MQAARESGRHTCRGRTYMHTNLHEGGGHKYTKHMQGISAVIQTRRTYNAIHTDRQAGNNKGTHKY